MNTEREPNPSEGEVERDFSMPEDPDYTTPGDPMVDDEHPADVDEERGNATPGNPL